ncbi:uroporphyrinogen-III synthase [Sediminicoccus sp. KRV36]|uniref:uroporphyrinogen-III synthase n=1 Tax=Sediminicoccus sp. KRV36 TaxID=3133721 RepID=UPI00200DA91A|nr:uroporphyrinogen-III synthase [Sediminicoccus rosea]UPY37624.1 uroporphyrinogen-III synthase [Sediminicoccus rosea]
MARGVLVTRPEPGAAETAARLTTLGWTPILAPALRLAPRPLPHPPRAQALLLTSRAAARALTPWPIPVLAVGNATAETARAQGFAQVRAAEGDAAALAALCARTLDPADGALLLAVGAAYSLDLTALLRARGFRVIRRVVYAAAEAPGLPESAARALLGGEVSHAMFFSPRSAACSLAAISAAGLTASVAGVEALAISPRVALALEALPWRRIRVARRPDQDHLLELLGTP